MSRTHAFAPVARVEAPLRRPDQCAAQSAAAATPSTAQPTTPCYVERALLLWPRLNRTRLHRIAHSPERIAELVCQRTSQPYDSILAMLTREAPAPAALTERSNGFESGRSQSSRISLRVMVRPTRNELDSIVKLPA